MKEIVGVIYEGLNTPELIDQLGDLSDIYLEVEAKEPLKALYHTEHICDY